MDAASTTLTQYMKDELGKVTSIKQVMHIPVIFPLAPSDGGARFAR